MISEGHAACGSHGSHVPPHSDTWATTRAPEPVALAWAARGGTWGTCTARPPHAHLSLWSSPGRLGGHIRVAHAWADVGLPSDAPLHGLHQHHVVGSLQLQDLVRVAAGLQDGQGGFETRGVNID